MEMLSNLLTVTGQVATLFLMMAVGFVPVSYTHLTLPTICSV